MANLALQYVSVVLLYMTMWAVVAVYRKDNGLADIAWGLGFVAIGLLGWLQSQFADRQLIVTLMVFIWGFRLALHVYARQQGKPEDFRYQKMRQNWGSQWKRKSFTNVFYLQGILMLIISLPVVWIQTVGFTPLTWWDGLGILVWIHGMIWEAVSDVQLTTFKSNPENAGKVFTKGLWKYSRHPNYFGEACVWWGFWLLAVSTSSGWLTVISPVLITFLLLRVSGVPMLERKYEGNPEYEAYCKQTNRFFPWFPKKT